MKQLLYGYLLSQLLVSCTNVLSTCTSFALFPNISSSINILLDISPQNIISSITHSLNSVKLFQAFVSPTAPICNNARITKNEYTNPELYPAFADGAATLVITANCYNELKRRSAEWSNCYRFAFWRRYEESCKKAPEEVGSAYLSLKQSRASLRDYISKMFDSAAATSTDFYMNVNGNFVQFHQNTLKDWPELKAEIDRMATASQYVRNTKAYDIYYLVTPGDH